jgi:serine protease Do
MKYFLRIIIMLIVISFVSITGLSRVSAQERDESFFGTIVSQAQPKMVKVFGAGAGRVESFATGILVSGEGHVLTTQGVFLDGRQVRVLLADGSEFRATVLRRDRVTQLALLKVEAETKNFFELSKSPVGEKGDWVVAITNAFKVADKDEPLSATLGVVSLRTSMEARLNRRDVAYQGDLVLIDAITSNPGAGGGAVVTTEGKLVGMVGKIINSSETNTRLNYAVPSAVLADFVEGKTTAKVAENKAPAQKADLGIVLFKLGGRNSPAYIDRVKRGTPAATAKLKTDDMIVSVAGTRVGNAKEYTRQLDALVPGEEIVLIVKRGKEFLRVPIVPQVRK